jgi:hypothetical protein
MSDRDAANTHEVHQRNLPRHEHPIVKVAEREAAKLPRWADGFPYVNGGCSPAAPKCRASASIARTYLLHIGTRTGNRSTPTSSAR